MAKEIRLPQLGQAMEEATIVGCMVKLNDKVKAGDVIFEIETDKATLEVESPAGGFVKHILVEVGWTLPVGAPILVLGDKDEKVPQNFVESLKAEVPAVPQSSPAMAEEAVTEAKLGETIPVNRLQKITAQKMLKSKQEIPCFYLNVKADVTDLVELRNKLNRTSDINVSYNDFIIKAIAIGLEKFPIMTGQSTDDTIRLAKAINIGLAITVPGGLVAPIIKDVNKKDIFQIALDSKALVEKARSNKLAPTDLEGGCITVSNLGAFGIESFIPIVVPGQCSIFGVGRICDTCMPDNGGTAIRKIMDMTLSVDHRVTNGAYAAQFLDFVRKLLEDVSTFE